MNGVIVFLIRFHVVQLAIGVLRGGGDSPNLP